MINFLVTFISLLADIIVAIAHKVINLAILTLLVVVTSLTSVIIALIYVLR